MKTLIALALGLLLLGGCAMEGGDAASGGAGDGASGAGGSGDGGSGSSDSGGGGAGAAVEESPGNALGPEDAPIYIRYFEFWPEVLTVEPGTTVVWINEDSEPHRIVSDPQKGFGEGGLFQSGSLGMGDTYSLTFIESGEYNYHCGLHDGMFGKVLVEE